MPSRWRNEPILRRKKERERERERERNKEKVNSGDSEYSGH
jgi:hypothetical protein